MIEYWGRILGAFLLIKVASALVRDAEKLVTANARAHNPEVAAVMDGNVEITVDEDRAIDETQPIAEVNGE